jgi:L-malate glycosyltransferase
MLTLPASARNAVSMMVADACPRPVGVCFLIDELNVAGTETQLLALIHHLDRARVRPYLALLKPHAEDCHPLEPSDCPVLRLGVRALRRPWAWRQAWRFARFLRQRRIDALMLYTPDSTYFGAVAGNLAGVPHILRVRNNLNHWMGPLDRWLGRLYNRLVTGTTVNCDAARQAVLRDERAPAHTITVLENGVDLERFLAIPPWQNRRNTGRRVGVAANLRRVKGLDIFVEAAAQLAGTRNDLTFHLAGTGEEQAALARQIDRRGVGRCVEICGSVSDIPGFLASLDVAVLPSRSEGMSNAVLEYMAAARPIVATAVGATPEVIAHGRHGLLVPPDDPKTLAGAIGQLLSDSAQAERLAAAARRRVRQHYSRQAMVERFEQFFESLV